MKMKNFKEEEGRQFAQEIGTIFNPTSASNGKGIKELFDKIGHKIINQKDENI